MAPNSFQNHARYAELVYTQALANRDTDALIRARKYFAQVPPPAAQPSFKPHVLRQHMERVCVHAHVCQSFVLPPHVTRCRLASPRTRDTVSPRRSRWSCG